MWTHCRTQGGLQPHQVVLCTYLVASPVVYLLAIRTVEEKWTAVKCTITEATQSLPGILVLHQLEIRWTDVRGHCQMFRPYPGPPSVN